MLIVRRELATFFSFHLRASGLALGGDFRLPRPVEKGYQHETACRPRKHFEDFPTRHPNRAKRDGKKFGRGPTQGKPSVCIATFGSATLSVRSKSEALGFIGAARRRSNSTTLNACPTTRPLGPHASSSTRQSKASHSCLHPSGRPGCESRLPPCRWAGWASPAPKQHQARPKV